MSRGLFITFEGLDKVGKSTQVEKLAEYLTGKNLKPVIIREPGSTELSEKIRNILLDKTNAGKITPMAEFMLYSAARAQLVMDIIRPAISEGKVIICDRYYDSSVAYQGYGRGLDIGFIDHVNRGVSDNIAPDLTILLAADHDKMKSDNNFRRFEPGPGDDRLERESNEFKARVQTGFLKIAEKNPERFLVVDGFESIEKISGIIIAQVDRLLKDRG